MLYTLQLFKNMFQQKTKIFKLPEKSTKYLKKS